MTIRISTFRTITLWTWFVYQFQRGDHAKVASIVDDMRALMHARNVSPVVAVNASATVAWYDAVVAIGSLPTNGIRSAGPGAVDGHVLRRQNKRP